MGIEYITYKSYDAVRLSNSHYSAIITHGRGCNIAELNDIKNNLALLHYPESDEAEEYENSCQRFGSAVLFPPNKVRDGMIHWNNRTYDLKSNQIPPAHGLIKEFPFEVVSSDEHENECYIKFRFNSIDSIYYKSFNWNFTCCFTYTLSLEGITQFVEFENNGDTDIPFGLGFHTAFRIPQNDAYSTEDYRILVSCGKQWELDKNGFPTGRLISAVHDYNHGCVSPLAAPLAEHLQAAVLSGSSDKLPFHGARIQNIKATVEFVYETDQIFSNWMIWNKNASDNFVCIEPMTCIIDAPNANIPETLHGFTTLKPQQHWEAKNRLYVQS